MKKWHFKAKELVTNSAWDIDEKNSPLKHIKFKKIAMKPEQAIEVVMNGNEMVVIVDKGRVTAELKSGTYTLGAFDAVYITNKDSCLLKASENATIIKVMASAQNQYVSKVIKRSEVAVLEAGKGPYKRKVWEMIGDKRFDADSIIFGYCEGEAGGWTGWPPHEHGKDLEELYYYYGIDDVCGGVVQFLGKDINNNKTEMEIIHDGDVCAIHSGEHPIVAFPGTIIKNAWFMASTRLKENRDMGLVKIGNKYLK
jgi:5-deoxy-glucuronate isomerase